MKKIFFAFIPLILVFSLCACSNENKKDNILDKVNYMNWKYSDWKIASDNEKFQCAKAFAKEISDIQQISSQLSENDFDDAAKKLEEQIETILKTDPTIPLGDTVNVAKKFFKNATNE